MTLAGKVLSKSDRLVGGEMLEIVLPEPKNPLEIVPVVVDDFRIVYEDDDIVVIDKPAGMAAHHAPRGIAVHPTPGGQTS